MQKRLILLSISFFTALVYLNESSSAPLPLNAPKVPTEHNILLDITLESDKVIYDNLVYSNYDCTLLNPKQAQCTQFKTSKEIISSNGAVEIYKYTSRSGKAFKLFQLANGEAHIEFKLNSSDVLYRYTFTSLERISAFTSHKGLFKTGSVEWDISSLNYIL